MSKQKMVGVGLLVVGVLLLVWGYNTSSSVSGRLGHALTGSMSWQVLAAYIVGATCLALGVKNIK